MGGEAFSNYAIGDDLQETFKKVRDQALYDHGHAGYSGTIAEKGEVVLRSTVDTREMAEMFAEHDMDKNEKWGPAFAVKITSEPKAFIFYGWASS
jgi:hypothetical protein